MSDQCHAYLSSFSSFLQLRDCLTVTFSAGEFCFFVWFLTFETGFHIAQASLELCAAENDHLLVLLAGIIGSPTALHSFSVVSLAVPLASIRSAHASLACDRISEAFENCSFHPSSIKPEYAAYWALLNSLLQKGGSKTECVHIFCSKWDKCINLL